MMSHYIHMVFKLHISTERRYFMIQSFEIWCDYCLKTKYYDDLKAIEDESFIKVSDSILCKSCAENNKIED